MSAEMEAGEVMEIPPYVAHAFEINRPTEFIEVADKAQGDDGELYDEDTVGVDDLAN